MSNGAASKPFITGIDRSRTIRSGRRLKIDPKRILNFMSRKELLGWAANLRDRDKAA